MTIPASGHNGDCLEVGSAGKADAICSGSQLPTVSIKPTADTKATADGSAKTDAESCSTPAVSVWTRKRFGLPLNIFMFGFIKGIMDGCGYGLFLGYFGLETHVLTAVSGIMQLPTVFVLPVGMLTDCVKIRGYNRKPYVILGWCLISVALGVMASRVMPGPYFCLTAKGYNYEAPPCNPDAHDEVLYYVLPMCLLALGLMLAFVGLEGLILEYSLLEHISQRGSVRTEMTMVSTSGQLAATILVALLLNSKAYLGSFDWGLSFRQLALMCMALCVLSVPFTCFCMHESKKTTSTSKAAHLQSSWQLMRSAATASVLVFCMGTALAMSMTTTAAPMVRSQLAKVRNLQQQVFGIAGTCASIVGLGILRPYLLTASWKKIFLLACLSECMTVLPYLLTVFDVVRNQYFFLGDSIALALPRTFMGLLINFMIIELAEPGKEGLCNGLAGTASNISMLIGTAFSNQLFGLFKPALTDVHNYVADTSDFRTTVAWSYGMNYMVTISSLVLLPLVPDQKEEAHRRKVAWGSRTISVIIVLVLLGLALIYSLTAIILAVNPNTACLALAGGQGC